MKRFDQQSIKDRIISRLRVNTDWALISENSVLDVVVSEIAETLAENSRYMEYLFNETKWDNALNLSSQTHMASLLGVQPSRPVSASGFVLVSHTDPEGVDRLSNLGKSFFDINEPSNYDNLSLDSTKIGTFQKALTPWLLTKPYIIPKGTIFTSNKGVNYISTTEVSSMTLTEPFESIEHSSVKYNNFLLKGGWENIKYVKVPVIQGNIKKISFGIAKGYKFESFELKVTNVENASTSLSKDFLKLLVVLPSGETEEWNQISNVMLASQEDKVFDVFTSYDGSKTIFRVGNGITGALLPKNAQIYIQYLESMGEKGNEDQKYSITTMSFPSGYEMIDPRTGLVSNFLSCTNIAPLRGGKDAEQSEEFKLKAPLAYLDSYSILTVDKYKDFIKKNSNVNIGKINIYKEKTSNSIINQNPTLENVVNSFDLTFPSVKIVALDINNNVISNSSEWLEDLVLKMGNFKAPNESLIYEPPLFINLNFNISAILNSSTLSITDAKTYLIEAIESQCGINKTEIGSKFEKNNIVQVLKNLGFFENLEVITSVQAEISYSDISLENINNIELVYIPFKFHEIFNRVPNYKGFADYTNQNKFLLKADISLIGVSDDTKSFTEVLLDNRTSSNSGELLNLKYQKEGKYYLNVNNKQINFYDETDDTPENGYQSRLVRNAQFNLTSEALTKTNIEKLLDFSNVNSERRPYEVNEDGSNKKYLISEVDEFLQIKIPGSKSYCYKKNISYIDNVDIFLNNETEGEITGGLIIPLSYFGFTSLELIKNINSKVNLLRTLMESKTNIKILAQPLLENIPSIENTLTSLRNKDDIKISLSI